MAGMIGVGIKSRILRDIEGGEFRFAAVHRAVPAVQSDVFQAGVVRRCLGKLRREITLFPIDAVGGPKESPRETAQSLRVE